MTHSFNIDIDSSYRDRLTYPECGNFVIPINTKNTQSVNGFNAKDPVILGFPYDTGLATAISVEPFFGGLQIILGASSRNQANFYVGSVIQIPSIDYYATIVSYDATTKEIKTLLPYGGPLPAVPFEYTIRFDYPQSIPIGSTTYVNTLPVNAPSTTQINIGPVIGLTKEILIGKYVYIQPPITILPWFNIVFPNVPPVIQAGYTYQWSLIIDYNSVTNVITVQKPFLIAPTAGTKYEILSFSYDNAQPLRYSGTEIFNNPRCTEVTLANITIPAYLPLANKTSGYIFDYPYIYVAFYTEGNRSYNQPIMSMNPYTEKALFKVTISPNASIDTTKFITLNTGITSQTVYFKHNDTFRFEIILPNGEIVKFNPAYFNFITGIFTYFLGLGFPIPSDPKANVQATFHVRFN